MPDIRTKPAGYARLTPEDIAKHISTLDADIVVQGPAQLAGRDPGEHPQNFGGQIVALPGSTEAAAAIIRWCAAHQVAVVPHGGRTGLAGGAVSKPGQLAVSTARMARLESLDAAGRTAVVQAGMTLHALQEAIAPHGLTTGIDLASRGTATIGGMVSTNAGGILAFRKGNMRHQVLGIEAVLPDGRVFTDMTKVVKVSAGLDLKHLLIGAEGALGLVTRVVLKLEGKRAAQATALIGVDNARSALSVIDHLRRRTSIALEGAEIMWEEYYRPNASLQKLDLSWLDAGARAILLIGVSGSSNEQAAEALETALAEIWDRAGIRGGIIAQSLDQSRRFWALREESGFIYRLYADAPSFDISIPPALVDDYVAGLTARLKTVDESCRPIVYGHLADGNLHISITRAGPVPVEERLRIEDALYRGIVENGGSFSAEHGVGLEKRHAYLTHASREKQDISRAVKRLFDPFNLFNPGKMPFI